MRPHDHVLYEKLANSLVTFSKEKHNLPGIDTPRASETFLEQLLESVHRVKYVAVLKTRKLSERSLDPRNEMFDPVKAAILHHLNDNIDEAFWLVFLLTHFGKNLKGGWQYLRNVYGNLEGENIWSWTNTSSNPAQFSKWLQENQDAIRAKGVNHGFGNHRKYESLDKGTGPAVESYINWVGPTHKHVDLIESVYQQSGHNPKTSFDHLFHSMNAVVRFGRTARFDYLTMVGHMGLANIEPGFAYLQNSTGPLAGAKLLFCGDTTAKIRTANLESWLAELEADLGVGMQVLEDALCNWQKSPEIFKKFRG